MIETGGQSVFVQGRDVPPTVRALLDELMHVQVLVEALPGPRLHQDHDFVGETEDLSLLKSWLSELIWVPYWGQPEGADKPMLFLGGRDPWIETLEMRVWEVLYALAQEAGCELVGRGSVSPEADELEEIRDVLPPIAEAHGWVFSTGLDKAGVQ
ncbi:MAG: hypothetical protein DI628_06695 [Blastochloris viridis]|uniref:Uncharacterized protein n=1 Tax=Blastochloris viridis TaxID=1079 RepID=A0A6N4QYZ5_BLAVI|nr:MAG: hypothetical protein DI628_06695 [Blastochloris viridis]